MCARERVYLGLDSRWRELSYRSEDSFVHDLISQLCLLSCPFFNSPLTYLVLVHLYAVHLGSHPGQENMALLFISLVAFHFFWDRFRRGSICVLSVHVGHCQFVLVRGTGVLGMGALLRDVLGTDLEMVSIAPFFDAGVAGIANGVVCCVVVL